MKTELYLSTEARLQRIHDLQKQGKKYKDWKSMNTRDESGKKVYLLIIK